MSGCGLEERLAMEFARELSRIPQSMNLLLV